MMVFKTDGEAFAFVSRNGWALEHVPEAAKTEDECIAAATLDCRVLRLLPAVKRQGENTVGDRLKTHHSLRPVREACPWL